MMIKKPQIKIIFFLLISIFLLNTLPVLADDPPSIFERMTSGVKETINKAYGGGQEVKVTGNTFADNLIKIINYLLTFVAILVFLLLIYSGYLWMNARGREEQVDKAKKITREAVIGLLIIILARLFTEFILSQIGTAIK